jgi:hypothetical protein
VKAVIDSAALAMHDVIITPYGCSNQALPWERWVRDGISRVPILARVREPAFVVDTKRENGRWQIPGRMNLLKGRGILQDLAILRWKLRDICVAEVLNSDREEQVKADLFHAQPNENKISHGGVDGKLAVGFIDWLGDAGPARSISTQKQFRNPREAYRS